MNTYCEKIKPLLSEYVDSSLDARRTAEIEQHLPSCPDCRQIVSDFRTNAERLGSLPLRQTSAGFDAALAARLAAINEQRSRKSWLSGLADAFKPSRTNVLRPAFATLAMVGVVAGVVFNLQPHQQKYIGPPPADPALIQQCVSQHNSYAESQPLGDPSAQYLQDQMDNNNAQADVEPDDDDTL